MAKKQIPFAEKIKTITFGTGTKPHPAAKTVACSCGAEWEVLPPQKVEGMPPELGELYIGRARATKPPHWKN